MLSSQNDAPYTNSPSTCALFCEKQLIFRMDNKRRRADGTHHWYKPQNVSKGPAIFRVFQKGSRKTALEEIWGEKICNTLAISSTDSGER
jgi:hypothetical protein